MAWEERTVKAMRKEFVQRVLAKEKSKAALCREYGISRPTGDKWVRRFQEGCRLMYGTTLLALLLGCAVRLLIFSL